MTAGESGARVLRRGALAILASAAIPAGAGAQLLPSAPTASPNAADANATRGASVSGGSGSTTPNALSVSVTQQSAVIDWTHFNVPEGKSATFVNDFSASRSAVLNRVIGDLDLATLARTKTATTLSGNLVGRGVEVWISKTAGIAFGPNGVVNVAGLVATTLDVDPGVVRRSERASLHRCGGRIGEHHRRRRGAADRNRRRRAGDAGARDRGDGEFRHARISRRTAGSRGSGGVRRRIRRDDEPAGQSPSLTIGSGTPLN
ncbi:filamentous hemagglutinin N-terminal domain-containing protein [Sphingomonas sp. MMS24-JH45]